jgi:hypothetical protein
MAPEREMVEVERPAGPTEEPAPERTPAHRRTAVTLNDIRLLAFRKWREAGGPVGDCARFWLEAERELVGAEG